MQCSAPPPLTDDQISAALDGEADPDVRLHLAQCASCAARLAEAQRIERGLGASLHRWDCPAPQRLSDYHLGGMSGEEDSAFARHLTGCASCRQEIEDLRVFLQAEEPPPIAAAPPAPRQPWRGPLIGRLLPRALVPGLRGSGAGPLRAEAGDTTIFLDVRPSGAGVVVLHCQVEDEDLDRWTGALVELRQGGALRATAEIDDLGTFSCGPVPAARSDLRMVPLRGRMIVLEGLELSA